MKRKKYVPYLVFILIALAVGGLSALVTYRGMPYYDRLIKPSFTPPSWLFPIVWNILYILMGVGAARVWNTGSPARRRAAAVFGFQLLINFFWSVWFFGAQTYLLAFFWLLLLLAAIALMIVVFYRVDRAAGLLQIPYFLWCCFAAALNLAIYRLN